MRYALDKNATKIEVEYSGQRALYAGCKNEVTGKIYKAKKDYWADLKKDCDSWYEPMSDWHIEWQNNILGIVYQSHYGLRDLLKIFVNLQRDITAKQAIVTLRNLPEVHYLSN